MIHRGTDLARFRPAPSSPRGSTALREAWGVAPHERIVLLAARLTGWKGQRVLIEAAARMRDRGSTDVAIVLAGDPQGRDGYVRANSTRLIAARGLEGVVRRVGHCADMPAAFLAASVVAVPSTEPEAFGRSAVEAQAMGAPVVVSDLGAVPETVLAPPDVAAGSAHRLARARRRRRRARRGAAKPLSPGRQRARGDGAPRARAHVERHFSLEQMTRDTLAVYAALLSRQR